MSDKTLDLVKETTEELLKKLELDIKVSVSVEGEAIKVELETPNPGLLIGFHGETLSSLQLIISLMVYKKTNKWTRISLNVGDYRQRREEQLSLIVQRILEQVKTSGQPQALPYLSSNERRIVHLMLQDSPDVKSESEGEGQNRRVIIKPKTQQTI